MEWNVWLSLLDKFWRTSMCSWFLMQDKDFMLSITIEDRWFIDLWECANSFATKSWHVLFVEYYMNILPCWWLLSWQGVPYKDNMNSASRTIQLYFWYLTASYQDKDQVSLKIKVYLRPEWRTLSEVYRRMMFLSSLLSSPRTDG